MKKIQISTFKAKCLQILDEVNRNGETIVITRRGEPLVEINPVSTELANKGFGIGAGTAKIKGDIISPVCEDDWEVLS